MNVTKEHVRAAEELEKEFARSGPMEVIDPPTDTAHYLCPKYYAECGWG